MRYSYVRWSLGSHTRRDEIFPKWGPAFPSSVPLSAMAAARSGSGMEVGAMSGRRGLGTFCFWDG